MNATNNTTNAKPKTAEAKALAKAKETELRAIFKNIDPHRAQEIREAYYKVVEGLRTLADELEIADAKSDKPGNDLMIHEHLLACQAMDAMDGSMLGTIL